jgi:hypothetical protein
MRMSQGGESRIPRICFKIQEHCREVKKGRLQGFTRRPRID